MSSICPDCPCLRAWCSVLTLWIMLPSNGRLSHSASSAMRAGSKCCEVGVPTLSLLRGKGKWTRTFIMHLCVRPSTGCSLCAQKLCWPSQNPFQVDIIVLTLWRRKGGMEELSSLPTATQPVSGGLDLILSASKPTSSDTTCCLWIDLSAVGPGSSPHSTSPGRVPTNSTPPHPLVSPCLARCPRHWPPVPQPRSTCHVTPCLRSPHLGLSPVTLLVLRLLYLGAP